MNNFRKTTIAAALCLINFTSFAGSVNASINAYGSSAALTINATVSPTNDFVSNNSKLYLAIVQGADVYFYSDTAGFVPYAGGLGALTGSNPAEAPPVRSITKGAETITLMGDARGVKGADVYVGYGATFAELISNGRYSKLYTMATRPEDLTLACIDKPVVQNPKIPLSASFDYVNNTWGANNYKMTGWQQCIGAEVKSTNSVVARWTYDWGANDTKTQYGPTPNIGAGYVKAYPSVIYDGKSTSVSLPKQLAAINSVPMAWDYNVTHSPSLSGDGSNVSFDVFFGTAANTAWADQKLELMVWTDTWGSMVFPNLSTLPVVTIGGQQYYLEVNKASSLTQTNNMTYVAYKSVSSQSKSSVDVMWFVNDMKQRGLLLDTDYMLNVQFGMEVAEGKGDMRLNDLTIEVK